MFLLLITPRFVEKTGIDKNVVFLKIVHRLHEPNSKRKHHDTVTNTSSVVSLSTTMLITTDCMRAPVMCVLETAEKVIEGDKPILSSNGNRCASK